MGFGRDRCQALEAGVASRSWWWRVGQEQRRDKGEGTGVWVAVCQAGDGLAGVLGALGHAPGHAGREACWQLSLGKAGLLGLGFWVD